MKGLAEKYRGLALPVRAGFWFTVCSAVQNGASFLSMPLLVRLLTAEDYGIYCVFRSWVNIIAIFATLKMCTDVFNNAMYKYPGSRDEYTSCAQSISMTGTAVCLLIYLALGDYERGAFGLPGKLSLMIFVQLFFTESYNVWTAKQRYEYRYKGLLISTAAYSLSYFLLPVLAGYAAPENMRLTAVIYSGTAVQVLFGLGFMIYNYYRGRRFFCREYWRFAIGFNLPLIPHFLSSVILGESDRVMIKDMAGADKAGIYSFVYTIAIVVNIVTTAAGNAFTPKIYEALGKKDYSAIRKAADMLLAAVGGLILLFACIAPELIRFFATPDYYEAIRLVPVIALSSYFGFLFTFFSAVEFFYERNKMVAAASVTGAVLNILLNFLLIPVFGYFAAGYTTFICYVVYSLIHYVFMKRVLKEKQGGTVYDERGIFFISLAVTAGAFLMLTVYENAAVRYLLAAGLTAVGAGAAAVVKRRRQKNRG